MPIYGDMAGFPPTILTSGTRDLLLSNTVRVHRKLRNLGIESFLQVYEGQSHAQYGRDDRIPEVREAFGEIATFFNKHLSKKAGSGGRPARPFVRQSGLQDQAGAAPAWLRNRAAASATIRSTIAAAGSIEWITPAASPNQTAACSGSPASKACR